MQQGTAVLCLLHIAGMIADELRPCAMAGPGRLASPSGRQPRCSTAYLGESDVEARVRPETTP